MSTCSESHFRLYTYVHRSLPHNNTRSVMPPPVPQGVGKLSILGRAHQGVSCREITAASVNHTKVLLLFMHLQQQHHQQHLLKVPPGSCPATWAFKASTTPEHSNRKRQELCLQAPFKSSNSLGPSLEARCPTRMSTHKHKYTL